MDQKYLDNPKHCPYPKGRKLVEELEVGGAAQGGQVLEGSALA
jgi:hypothetical protein